MKGQKRLIILLVGVICLAFIMTAYSQDFRQVNWGMSKDEVIGVAEGFV